MSAMLPMKNCAQVFLTAAAAEITVVATAVIAAMTAAAQADADATK